LLEPHMIIDTAGIPAAEAVANIVAAIAERSQPG
jgi:hypothetical protein